MAMPARYVGGPTYSELESDLQAERTKREVLESELNILREEMAAVSSENEALRRETQLVRKEKEAMGRRHGMDASVADVRGRRSGDPRAAIKATRHEPDAAKELPTSKDTVRSNSPKSKRLRMLEEMVECKDIEIASIKDHNKRMEEWNKEQLQKVRDLQNNVNQESEKRRSAEQDLKEVQTETNKIMQDLGMRPKRFTKGKRG